MSLLINQDFEGTGTPSGWFRGGSADFDYSAVPLAGSQSLRCDAATSDTGRYLSGGALNHDEFWVRMLVKFESISTSTFFYLQDSGFDPKAEIIVIGGALYISDEGPTFQGTVDTMSAGTTYNVWVHYKKGTGSNGILEASFDVAGNPRPNSGNKFTGVTNSTVTGTIAQALLNAGNTSIVVFDDFQVADTDMFGAAVDVTVNLTGVGASLAVGVLGFNGSLPLVGVAAVPVIGTGTVTFTGDVSVSMVGVAANPRIGIGTVAIEGEVITPPVEDLVPGPRWYGLPEDEKVYLTGVAANPQVGEVKPFGKVTRDEFEKMYPFPKRVEERPLPVARKKAKPPKPTTFVYMVGVHPVPKIGRMTIKAFYEDSDEELSSILKMMDVDEELISALKLAK